jgi:hypothetical protein
MPSAFDLKLAVNSFSKNDLLRFFYVVNIHKFWVNSLCGKSIKKGYEKNKITT